MIEIFKKLFGLNGGTVINKATGFINWLVTVPTISYLVANSDKQIHMDTSLGFLAVVVGFIFVIVEIARRSKPNE